MVNFLWENLFQKNKRDRDLTRRLKENVLFQDLDQVELSLVEKIVNVRNYRAGETVFRQGELGVGMYIIAKGKVNIYVEEIVASSAESQSILVTQLGEGDFLGDLALVEANGRRSATAICQEESVLVGFFKPDLVEVTQRSPSAGVKILMRLGEVLGLRLRETTSKITELKKELKK